VRRAMPVGVDSVVDTITRAELAIDPILCDKETRRWLQGKVDDRQFDPTCHGASSDLPIDANQSRWRPRATLARRLQSDITGHAGAFTSEYLG
jgi:hypothetical protein